MEAIVQTSYGRVRGTTAANGVCAFLGISYAAPLVDAHRLRPPQPVEPWTGIRDATILGPEPPQPSSGRRTSRDCIWDHLIWDHLGAHDERSDLPTSTARCLRRSAPPTTRHQSSSASRRPRTRWRGLPRGCARHGR
jgi:hypothetical protein